MDELQISGKRFISSRRIAKDNGYHTDYIGQLIRGGKIKGQKVGRTWYVDAESFNAYLGEEGATHPATVEPIQESAAAEAPVAPVVEAPVVEEPIVTVEEAIVAEPVVHVAVRDVEPVAHIEIKKEIVEELAPQVQEVIAPAPTPTPAVPKPIVPASKIELVGGLRYVRDDEPLLPEIAPQPTSSRHIEIKKESAAPVHEPPVVAAPIVATKRSRWSMAALALVGVVVFGFSAYVSSTLIQTINIDAGNPASVSYSMHW